MRRLCTRKIRFLFSRSEYTTLPSQCTEEMAAKFCVVDFTTEGVCEVVPSSWLESNGNTCQFPKNKGPNITVLKHNYLTKPKTKWPSYAVNIKCFEDNYVSAVEKATAYQFTSNVESSSEDEIDQGARMKLRKRKIISIPQIDKVSKKGRGNKPAKVVDSDSDNLDIEAYQYNSHPGSANAEFNSSVEQTLEFVGENSEARGLETCQDVIVTMVTAENAGNCFSSTGIPVIPQGEFGLQQFEQENSKVLNGGQEPPTSSASVPICNNGIIATPHYSNFTDGQNFVGRRPNRTSNSELENLTTEFRRFERVLLNEVLELKTELGIIKRSVAKTTNYESLICPLDVPLKNKSSWDVAEELLQDVSINAKLYTWCEITEGKDYKHHMRRLLTKVFTHSFSLEINFTGVSKKGSPKLAFQGTRLCAVIIASVSRSHNKNEAEVEQYCGRWFWGGVDRNGGRSQRS
ncbi:unnamed protein product [Allacma fusca]|uniref:Uncharacterized protein n=1 Tax=Allacma fusca TaxID=39272 RepID=A0A8J2JS52_9HEXA|nr:unnamed protein product [Allacma fusca]